jgi:hypothetical protein
MPADDPKEANAQEEKKETTETGKGLHMITRDRMKDIVQWYEEEEITQVDRRHM